MGYKTIKHLILLSWLIFATLPTFAQKKKKVTPGQNQRNILKRAYSDVLTRNNYYFNSQIIYKDMLTNYKQTRKVDYDDLLPFYFHDWSADFSAYNTELETIVKKTSIVSQIRNESRWQDDVYVMLGKARYLQQDYKNAFETFRFVVTTMEGADLGKSVSKYNQKDRYKYLKKKQKEIEKQSKEKKKEQDLKNKIKEKITKALKKSKEKEIAQTAKQRQKELEKKIKLKKKAIKKKAKGKTVKKNYQDIKPGQKQAEDVEKEPEEVIEKIKVPETPKDSIDKYKNIQVKNIDYKENDQQGVASDTLTDKELALLEKLTLWEKLKHKKSRPEAIVWMAKSAIQRGDMATAKNMILYGQEMKKLTKKQLKELYLAEAYYYIHRNSFDLAIEPLMVALEWTKKDEKVWYLYILSQFYEKLNQPEDASILLEKAIESRGDYKTRLYAKISKARIDAENNLDNMDDIIKELAKLGKKNNNKAYRSDIFFALAEIYHNSNQYQKAAETYKLSLQNSENNPKKQTLSYVELSNLYYKQNNYVNASNYMDSALIVNDPVIKSRESYYQTRQRGLKIVADKTTIISENDSLLELSFLSDTELASLIRVAEKEDKKNKRKANFQPERSDEGDAFFLLMQNAPTIMTSSNADWYFYNEELKTRGFNEFRSIWGNRKLQDNWRRTTVTFDSPIEQEMEISKKVTGKDTLQKDNTPALFSRIPKTAKQRDSIKTDNVSLYYDVAVAFMQNLEDPKKAIYYFEKLLSLNIEFERTPETYYALYLLYKDIPNLAKANMYKDLLISKYPTNIIARNLTYQLAEKRDTSYTEKIEKLYASTYQSFQNGEYNQVIKLYETVHKNHGENLLTPRFKFLQALSYGHIDSVETLKKILLEIVNKYPNHEVRPKATEYLAILNQEKIAFLDDAVSNNKEDKKKKTTEEASSLYKPDDDNTSLFGMILINNPQVNIQDVMKNLSDFNDKYFKDDGYKISNAFLSVKEPLLLIKRFKNKNDGIKYYNSLLDKKAETFGKFNVDAIEVYLISQNNFKELFGSKDIKQYRQFFINSYLNDK